MRFLLNMNIPRELGRKLVLSGYEYRHVGDIEMAQASDIAIILEARASGEIILTHDLDYSHLLAFSGEQFPSVVIFRTRNTHPNNLFAQLMNSWHKIKKSLYKGAIVVIEDSTVRVRKLPIIGEE